MDPALRELTAYDEPVRRAVLDTDGIRNLIDATAAAVTAYRSGPSARPVTVAVGCAGGRHRAATVAMTLQSRLAAQGITARTTHRDIGQDVVQR